MKIAESHTLQELVDIFNFVSDKIKNKEGPGTSAASALYYFPDVFSRPRDEYVTAFLHEVCLQSNPEDGGFQNVNAYLGNIHVDPITRIWQTAKTKSAIIASEPEKETRGRNFSPVIKQRKRDSGKMSLNYIEHCRLPHMYDINAQSEKAEVKISKHALLEALFGT
jgi:hypothetical protein